MRRLQAEAALCLIGSRQRVNAPSSSPHLLSYLQNSLTRTPKHALAEQFRHEPWPASLERYLSKDALLSEIQSTICSGPTSKLSITDVSSTLGETFLAFQQEVSQCKQTALEYKGYFSRLRRGFGRAQGPPTCCCIRVNNLHSWSANTIRCLKNRRLIGTVRVSVPGEPRSG